MAPTHRLLDDRAAGIGRCEPAPHVTSGYAHRSANDRRATANNCQLANRLAAAKGLVEAPLKRLGGAAMLGDMRHDKTTRPMSKSLVAIARLALQIGHAARAPAPHPEARMLFACSHPQPDDSQAFSKVFNGATRYLTLSETAQGGAGPARPHPAQFPQLNDNVPCQYSEMHPNPAQARY
jgi:hypothetical protein